MTRPAVDDIPDLVLRHVADVHVDLGPILDVADVAGGRRRVVPIVGGRIEGDLVRADILPGGADTQLLFPDGSVLVDTRYAARTDDGHPLTLATTGYRHGPPDVLMRVAAGQGVDPREYSFTLIVHIESAAPALTGIERRVLVASAARREAAVDYRLYEAG